MHCFLLVTCQEFAPKDGTEVDGSVIWLPKKNFEIFALLNFQFSTETSIWMRDTPQRLKHPKVCVFMHLCALKSYCCTGISGEGSRGEEPIKPDILVNSFRFRGLFVMGCLLETSFL